MSSGLEGSEVVAFLPTTNPARSKEFFTKTLGLTLIGEDQFALVLEANGTTVRVADVSSVPGFKPAPFTVLGWVVDDIGATVKQLASRGVVFERFPGMQQDARGVWMSPTGAHVAWFKDPEGNVLSVTET